MIDGTRCPRTCPAFLPVFRDRRRFGLPRAGGAGRRPRRGPRIVAVGDIHGAGPGLAQILQAAGLIDAKQKWIGGNARLVQTGDILDRGADVRAADRPADAARGGGAPGRRPRRRAVRQPRGHERPARFPRRLARQRWPRFADGRSDDRLQKAFDSHAVDRQARRQHAQSRRMDGRRTRAVIVEYVEAFGPSGPYGRWMRARKAVLQIGDTIFMHAGLHPERTITIDEINRAVEQDVRGWDDLVSALERVRRATANLHAAGDHQRGAGRDRQDRRRAEDRRADRRNTSRPNSSAACSS